MGKNVPNNKTFETCFNGNKDGAGYMYSYKGKVHIEKGLMTFDDFKKSLSKTYSKIGGKKCAKKIAFVYHFRITTQGGVQPELTHPFSLSEDYADMRKLSNVCDFGVAHNGIITATSDYSAKDHNDTMTFIKEIAYPLLTKNKTIDKNCIHNILEKFLHGNRVVILDGNGNAEMFGDWIEDNGVYYSNSGYKPYDFKRFDYYSKWWENFGTAKRFNLSARQKSDIKLYRETFCDDCAGDLMLDYDVTEDRYILICTNCGQEYYIDDDLAEIILDDDYCYGNAN